MDTKFTEHSGLLYDTGHTKMCKFLLQVALLFLLSCNLGRCWQWCYVCSQEGKSGSCQKSPVEVSANAKAINCTSKYCTTVMVTYKDGETHSFARLCENIDRGNWCLHDSFLTTCYMTCKTHFCNNRVPDARYLPSGGHFGPLPKAVTLKQKPVTTLKFNQHKTVQKNEWTSRETVENEEPTNSVFRPRIPPSSVSSKKRKPESVQAKERKSLKVKSSLKPTEYYNGPSYKYLGKTKKNNKQTTVTTQVISTTKIPQTSTVSVRSDKQKSLTVKPTISASSKARFSQIASIMLLIYPILLL